MDRRHLLSALIGAAVGVALFWLMPRLVEDRSQPPAPKPAADVSFTHPRIEREPEVRPTPQPKPPKPAANSKPATPISTEAPPVDGPEAPTLKPTPPSRAPGLQLSPPPEVDGPGDGSLEEYGLRVKRYFAPNYPPIPQRDGIEGWVEVEFTVTVDGGVRDVRVVASKPRNADLERAAVGAMARWLFEPPLRDGAAVEVVARQRFDFSLDDD